MKTEIIRVTEDRKTTLANLLEIYNYEFSQYDKLPFDDNGLFGYEYLDEYFTENDRFAYFIYADGQLAGFALLNKYPECDRPIDWSIAEFFVSYNFRRQGVATEVIEQIFAKHKGCYHIKYHRKNTASVIFWNKIARKYSGGNYEIVVGDEPYYDGTPATVLVFEVK